nr:er lumen protein-retaining receptor [Quercus suber]
MLGSYRFFYEINWIVRAATEEGFYQPVSVIFGIVQTLLYVDFAWVYWTRQRVKLRGGGLVDGDDLSKSFLVRRFIARRTANDDAGDDEENAGLEDQENGVIHAPVPRSGRSWGVRGISVSADDTLPADGQDGRGGHDMVHPAQFDDGDFDDDADAPPPPAKDDKLGHALSTPSPPSEIDEASAQEGGSSAAEWQSNPGK